MCYATWLVSFGFSLLLMSSWMQELTSQKTLCCQVTLHVNAFHFYVFADLYFFICFSLIYLSIVSVPVVIGRPTIHDHYQFYYYYYCYSYCWYYLTTVWWDWCCYHCIRTRAVNGCIGRWYEMVPGTYCPINYDPLWPSFVNLPTLSCSFILCNVWQSWS